MLRAVHTAANNRPTAEIRDPAVYLMKASRPSRPAARAQRRRERSRGQALVELALVIPILCLLFAMAADFSRLFALSINVTNAAHEGATFGANNPSCISSTSGSCANPNNVQFAARREVGGVGTDAAVTVSSSCSASCASSTTAAGNSVTVAVSRPFTSMLPGIPNITVASSATSVIK